MISLRFLLKFIIIIIINEVFCSNPVQQDENLIFTVQERNINIIINLIYEMNNWLSNVYVDRSDNGNKKNTIENGKKKNKFTKYIKNNKERKWPNKINENIEIKMSWSY